MYVALRDDDKARERTMQAMVYHRYGSPDVLALEEVPTPVAGEGEVLVRVKAASLNALDWHLVRGIPYIVRSTAGWRRPKRPIPGVDVAGTVEAVGTGVTQFAPGDAVFGEKSRSCAEFVAVREDMLVAKPERLTFEQAAAMPAAGVTALQALREKGDVQAGQRVLVNGAAGGCGTFTVQIAKALGADVTAVCRTPNVDLVRSLGADEVIDYTQHDFTRNGQRYDLIIDNVGNRSLLSMRRVMEPGGKLVIVGAPDGRWIAPIARVVWAGILSRFVSQTFIPHLTDTTQAHLADLVALVEAGQLTPVIDRAYPLRETPDALRYLETMHARAKVVITLGGGALEPSSR